jgi:hypothetical protein
MEEQRPNDTVLVLGDEPIIDLETGGEDAILTEPGVLLLSNELPPEPVIRKIDVGPRVSGFSPAEIEAVPGVQADLARIWHVPQPGQRAGNPIPEVVRPLAAVRTVEPRAALETMQPARLNIASAELERILSDAQAFAAGYDAMKARTRKALYEALGRTYDFAIRAEQQPAECARLIEIAGLTVQERAPYSPIVKLVFGEGYDKTRVAEFAAAITYGRRKDLPIGGFAAFLDRFEGGLKAIVGLERLMRRHEPGAADHDLRAEARPAIASKLRQIMPATWDELPVEGDEFALLVARRLPDGTIGVIGEVPRDIALLERAARKLLAELDRAGEGHANPADCHPEEV